MGVYIVLHATAVFLWLIAIATTMILVTIGRAMRKPRHYKLKGGR
jgi:hypothetical protein